MNWGIRSFAGLLSLTFGLAGGHPAEAGFRGFLSKGCPALLSGTSEEIGDFVRGNLWKPLKVEPGSAGGRIITTTRYVFDAYPDPGNSKEGTIHFIHGILSTEAARFFGYTYRDRRAYFWVKRREYTLPDRVELMGRIRRFNTALLPHEAHLGIRIGYFDSDLVDPPEFDRALEFLKWFANGYWPFAKDGHFFFHDANFHVSLVLLPPEIVELSQKQTRLFVAFLDWLAKEHPQIAQTPVKSYEALPRVKIMNTMQFLAQEYETRIDFGNGNTINDLAMSRSKGESPELVWLNRFAGELRPPASAIEHFLNLDSQVPHVRPVYRAYREFIRDFALQHPWVLEPVPLKQGDLVPRIEEHLQLIEKVIRRVPFHAE